MGGFAGGESVKRVLAAKTPFDFFFRKLYEVTGLHQQVFINTRPASSGKFVHLQPINGAFVALPKYRFGLSMRSIGGSN